MGGIVGAWNLDGRPMPPELLATMSSQIRHRGVDGEGHRVAGAAGLSCQHLWSTPEDEGEPQPRATANGSMLVIDGRIDNREELNERLGLDRTAGNAACVLAAYEAWDEGFAERLNGDFAVAVFDVSKQRLTIARDPIGVRPLYFFRSERLFAFASEIKALLVHPDIPVAPDEDGIADFMFIGARALERPDLTCFKGISTLVPAHLGTISASGIRIRRYWDFDKTAVLRLGSIEEYVEVFRERFAEAVRRRARSHRPVAVSVSGGLDSSAIFCQAETLRRSGASPHPQTVGLSHFSDLSENDERAFLHDIEHQYGVSIIQYPIGHHIGIVDHVEEQVRTIEAPFLDCLWGVSREVHTRAAQSGARVLLTGHWGDQVLFSPAYLIDLFNQLSWPDIWRHTREHRRYLGGAETWVTIRRLLFALGRHHVPEFLTPPLKWLRLRLMGEPQAKPWLSDTFLATTRRIRYQPVTLPGRFHSAHARAVYLEARSKYHMHSMEWNNKVAALHGLDVAFPMLDRDLLVFLMAIPGEVHAWKGVPRSLLRDSMRGVLPDTIRARIWKSDFSPFVNQGAARDVPAMLGALTDDCHGVRLGYFDRARLRPEMARLGEIIKTRGPTECSESWALTDTFGLEMWLRVFSELKKEEAVACQ